MVRGKLVLEFLSTCFFSWVIYYYLCCIIICIICDNLYCGLLSVNNAECHNIFDTFLEFVKGGFNENHKEE